MTPISTLPRGSVEPTAPHALECDAPEPPASFTLDWAPMRRPMLWEIGAYAISFVGLMIPLLVAYEPLFDQDGYRLRRAILEGVLKAGLPEPTVQDPRWTYWRLGGGLDISVWSDGRYLISWQGTIATSVVMGLVGRRVASRLSIELATEAYRWRQSLDRTRP